MAQHKLNTFHWHLSDDNGWRIEIKKLSEADRSRRVAQGNRLTDWIRKPARLTDKDGRYGGFYTQDDIREIVAYAKARYITIVPEIDMPGHSAAALSVVSRVQLLRRPLRPR